MAGVSDCRTERTLGGDGMMEEFIRSVTEQIRCVRARDGVARELSDHIEDQAAAYEEAGESHEEAVAKAVREMGDPVDVGVELDRIHRPQTDFKMIGMAFAFSVAGLFVISAVDGLAQYPESFIRQCFVLLLSFGVMTGMYFLDYSFIGRYAYGAYVFVTVALYIGLMYSARHGAMPISFMLAYLYVPLYAGILYRLRGKGYSVIACGIGLQIIIMLLTNYLAVSRYAAINIYMMCTVLLIIAVWKGWFAVNKKTATAIIAAHLLLAGILVIVGIIILWDGGGFREQRLMAFIHPDQYAEGAGYIYMWIRREWSAAKLIGASESSFFIEGGLIRDSKSYLIGVPMSYPTTPFVFLQLICTYGIVAGLAMVVAFVAVIIRAFRIVKNQKNQLGFMISAACFMVFLVNCLEGVLINTGYCPVNSLQLPFVSYGACTAMTYAALIGLLLSIHRNERIITDESVRRRPAWRLSIKLEKR